MRAAALGALGAFALIVCLPVPAGWCEGVSRVIEYRSPLDGSLQAYGVYLPDTPPPTDAGYPAVLHGHGYGWSVSASFSDFQKRWAEEHGWIMINLNARGPNFYEGVGDIETLNVIEDAAAHFGVDRGRVYFTGGSMGGTGALRAGLRHPDVFAAVMGVDGWTDFREWHWHWYARTDVRDLIEEFRRPLLEAASPLYWAARGRWGATGHIVDGADTTVLPENGLRLREALYNLGVQDLGTYDQLVVYNPTFGHGRGTNLQTIYDYFFTRSLTPGRGDFLVQTTILPHGELYWGRIEAFHVDGMTGVLEGHADGPAITALTSNLDAFTLLLAASPSADEEQVEVWADGFLAYCGPPDTVTLQAEHNAAGALIGWAQAGMPDADPAEAPMKTPGLSGPVGDAFLRPFVVAYASAGSPAAVRRHREEAQQFAQSWNDFLVHGPGAVAVPEDAISAADINARTLVLFGALDSSSLLRRANLIRELPVQVRNDGVIVRDPVGGDRRYMGEKYGALVCYPNPLSDMRTYLVVCNRRIFTKPDGQVPQMLGYDLEKLPWAYPDYLVFDYDQSELPFTLNVNNKPPVTCYEAAQFVEAGYFDDHWRPDRGLQIRRVRAQKPELHRFIHIEQIELSATEPGDVPLARVRITDSGGGPVSTARVTGRWTGVDERAASAVTDEQGWCELPAAEAVAEPVSDSLGFAVVNVMATGCTYDWSADRLQGRAAGWAGPGRLQVIQAALPPDVTAGDPVRVAVAAMNGSNEPLTATVRLTARDGEITPGSFEVALQPGERRDVQFRWVAPEDGPGRRLLRAEAIAAGADPVASASCPVVVNVLPPRDPALAMTEVKGADIVAGKPWSVTARITNYGCSETVTATVRCAILEARRYPPAKTAQVQPGETVSVTFTGPDDDLLDPGEYTARVSVAGARGATAVAKFAVRPALAG